MRIMVGEDNVFIAMTLVDDLEALGHEVVGPFPTAEAAVAVARDAPPDLALMDIRLEGEKDGTWAAEQLAAMNIPTVLVSSEPNRAKAAFDHAVGFLPKPVAQHQLQLALEAVEQFLKGDGVPEEAWSRSGFQLFGWRSINWKAD